MEQGLGPMTFNGLRFALGAISLTAPKDYPAKRFEEAWNQVLLYSEHTWGAYCSVRKPDIPFTADQWTVKKSYATTANLLSRQLLLDAAQVTSEVKPVQTSDPVDIYNTTAFTRSDVTLLSPEVARGISTLADEKGKEGVPVQRLKTGDLAVWVEGLPPFSGRRYVAATKPAPLPAEAVRVTPTTLENERIFVRLDPKTGSIVELRRKSLEHSSCTRGHTLSLILFPIKNPKLVPAKPRRRRIINHLAPSTGVSKGLVKCAFTPEILENRYCK
jgi:hypothetical protein